MNTAKPLVSVLMPAYNCSRFVAQAIDCVLQQTYQHIELLVADDASTDDTKKIIDGYTDVRVRRFHNPANMGYLKTWNKLIKEAKGEYITFLDGDDTCTLDRLELLLSAFEKDPELGAVGSNYHKTDVDGKILFTSKLKTDYSEIKAAMPGEFNVVGSGLMIKKEVYQKVGGYHEFFDRIGAEDYYWVYLIAEKFKLINLPEALYNYRTNPNSVAGNLSDNHRKMLSLKVVKFLVEQRQNTGTDSFESGKMDEFNSYLAEIEKPYLEDKSYFFRQIASRYYYEGKKWRGVELYFKALQKNPANIENHRNLFYFLRITIKDEVKELIKKILMGNSLLNKYVYMPIHYRSLKRDYLKLAELKELTPEQYAYWQDRTQKVMASSDNRFIPRHPDAGEIIKGHLVMHNGLIIEPLSYYGAPVLRQLILNKGVHEPQEERVFNDVLKGMRENATMLELGCFWGFYSMWFNKEVKGAKNYMVDHPVTMQKAVKNFALNNMKGDFTGAYIGHPQPGADIKYISVDQLVKEKGIDFIDILHSDIQGFEYEMLEGVTETIAANKIGYVFISTHSNELHENCKKFLLDKGFELICDANLDESYSEDGLIVVKAPHYKGIAPMQISKRGK